MAIAVAAAAAVVVGASAGLMATRSDVAPGVVESQGGRAAPSFDLAPVRDGERRVTLPTGDKPVVLNFFASWCEPCKDELPVLRQAATRRGDEFTFLGIAHLDQRDDAREMLEDYGITYAAGHDPGGRTAPQYRLRGLPGTVFIRPDGTIASVKHGAITATDLERHLEATLHEGSE